MKHRPEGPQLVLPVGERDHAQGSASALITLVEYGDYECPHCAHAHPIIQAVQKRLGGKLRLVFRNFPLREMHPHAENAAEAAEAAAAQGKFWQMHDALFENQDALGLEDIARYAVEVKIDPRRFGAELETHTHAPRVREDFISGVRSGVNGTPTFFLNGTRYDGSWEEDDLVAAIESAV
jgi:protein-disulfide isomerase